MSPAARPVRGEAVARTPASSMSAMRQLSGCEREPEQVRTLYTTYTTYGSLWAPGVQPVSHPLFTEADDTPGGTDLTR